MLHAPVCGSPRSTCTDGPSTKGALPVSPEDDAPVNPGEIVAPYGNNENRENMKLKTPGVDKTSDCAVAPREDAIGVDSSLSALPERNGTDDCSGSGAKVPGECGEAPTPLQLAATALQELYEIHDTFFSAAKEEKKRRLEAKAAEVQAALSAVGDVSSNQERARVAYIRGRCLDVHSEFDEEAEKCLARAVKLRPSDPDAWNALGHCYWKKADLFAAKRCFMQALDKDRRVGSLRQLSMLLRQLPGSGGETADYLEESLRLAKEAVTRDVTSGDSWYVLGNAYVASFFRNSRGMKDLDRALQAYAKAEASGADGNPDLFFNRAQVLLYREDYQEAARDYRTAQKLDPSLPASQALRDIEAGVERLAELVEKKGGLKPKRLSQLVSPLKAASAGAGPNESYRMACLEDLRLGVNAGLAIALKLVMLAGQGASPPERLITADARGVCCVLSIYSITKEACDKIQSKDLLVIRNPALRRVTLCPRSGEPHLSEAASKGSSYSFLGIQADPADMLVNGKSMRACFAPSSVRLANFDK